MIWEPETDELDEFRQANLTQVWDLYRGRKRIRQLEPLLRMSPAEREWRLRHHSEADIEEFETPSRQQLDKLLHFCGILEAGWRSGSLAFLNPPIPAEMNALLALPEVQSYFQVKYPLAHMTHFLRRTSSTRQSAEYYDPGWFSALLRLDAGIRDKKIVNFLLVLDDYWLGDANYQSLLLSIEQREVILEAVVTPRELRSPLQSTIAGLEAFLLFCDDLQDLLNRTEDKKELQEIAFDLYRYWFLVRGAELKDILNKAIAALSGASDDEQQLPSPSSIDRLFQRAHAYPSISARTTFAGEASEN